MNKIYILLHFSLFISTLKANQGCDISSLIKKRIDSSTPTKREEKIEIKEEIERNFELKITEELNSIEIIHENQKLIIKRSSSSITHTCPPFCIQPMKIKGVKTVGELEVLDFIKDLKGKKAKLLIDIRSNNKYKRYTIPGAINIPYSMLQTGSKYQSELLTLLGGKKDGGEWLFKFVPKLLIFGDSNEDSTAIKAIKTLIKLSYPNRKIYYYRAGIKEWSSLGLTLY